MERIMGDEVSILIVDDEMGMRETLLDILEDVGYHTAVAVDGYEAIERVKERAFDAIFTDVKMPGMDGVDTFKEIKKIHPEAAVVMMTAYAVDDRLREAMREGVYSVIRKPLDIGKMIGLIEGMQGER
jgi:DNA-binding NtrC family response regulator